MRRLLLVGAVVLLVVVPAALADDSNGDSGAAAACKALQQTSPALFGAGKTYKNLGACVSSKSGQASENATNAAKTCKTEQADANFAGAHGGKSFSDFYGTNPNKKNAFGKCVSGKAKSETDDDNQAELNGAKQCKTQRADASFAGSHGGKSFSDFYGINANKKNAFGKCVSALANQK